MVSPVVPPGHCAPDAFLIRQDGSDFDRVRRPGGVQHRDAACPKGQERDAERASARRRRDAGAAPAAARIRGLGVHVRLGARCAVHGGGLPEDDRPGGRRGRLRVQGPSAYAQTRLRLRAGEGRSRHAGPPGLARATATSSTPCGIRSSRPIASRASGGVGLKRPRAAAAGLAGRRQVPSSHSGTPSSEWPSVASAGRAPTKRQGAAWSGKTKKSGCVRLRTILRFAKDSLVATGLKEFIAEAEDRLEMLERRKQNLP
jgi:hypothetical protein